jgi:phospholipid/cholesterol/gamma-HCH transport system substrate-binding protein
MNEQALRFRIGVFMLLALILLAVLILMFGGLPTYFKKTSTYTIVFDNAPGIGPGTPVKRSGVKIGEVRSIELDNLTGKVNVGIRVEQAYTLRKSDRPTIVQGLLGGDASVAFLPPEDPKLVDAAMVEPGAILRGYVQVDASQLLQRVTDLMPQAQEALIEIRKAFARLQKAEPDLENIFRDFRDLTKIIRDAVPELRKTNDEIRDLVKTVRTTVPDFKRTGDEIQAAARSIGKVGERVDVFLQNNEDKLTRSLDRVQEALKKFNELLNEENQKNVTVIIRNVKDTSAKLDALTRDAQGFLKEGGSAMKSLGDTMARADEVLANLNKATRPLGERGPTILKNVDESTANLNRAMSDLRELLQAVARSEGTVQKLITDPSLYNNLNDSTEMVKRILPRLDRVLRDVEIFADKIARHPEALGLGGVIRPSSGLKENPTIIPPYYHTPRGSIIEP